MIYICSHLPPLPPCVHTCTRTQTHVHTYTFLFSHAHTISIFSCLSLPIFHPHSCSVCAHLHHTHAHVQTHVFVFSHAHTHSLTPLISLLRAVSLSLFRSLVRTLGSLCVCRHTCARSHDHAHALSYSRANASSLSMPRLYPRFPIHPLSLCVLRDVHLNTHTRACCRLTLHNSTADETWLEYAAQMLGARLVQYSEEVEGFTTYPHCLARYFSI